MTNVLYKNYFTTSVNYEAVVTPFALLFLFHKYNGIIILPNNTILKTELSNGIKIYRNKKAIKQITNLVNEYSLI